MSDKESPIDEAKARELLQSQREQIEAQLAEEYALDDAGAIADDVLALAAK